MAIMVNVTGSVAAVLYAVLLVSALVATGERGPGLVSPAVRPVATAAAVCVVAVPSLVQLILAPQLLVYLGRNRAQVAAGQWWRLFTSLVVQDGGWSGTIFNLVSLAVVGAAAEQLWGHRRWLVIAVASGVGAQFWGFVVAPVGGGNSVVVFGLAASISVLVLRTRRGRQPRWALLSLLAAFVLLLARDIHGGAAAIGAAVALVLARREYRQRAN